MKYYCKDCKTEFEVDDKECEGYYNWKCPNCDHIAVKANSTGLGIVWKCDTGTVKMGSGSSPCATCTKK